MDTSVVRSSVGRARREELDGQDAIAAIGAKRNADSEVAKVWMKNRQAMTWTRHETCVDRGGTVCASDVLRGSGARDADALKTIPVISG